MNDTHPRTRETKHIPPSVQHKLAVPTVLAGVMTDTVTVHRLKVRDRLEIQKSKTADADKEAALVAKALQLSMDDVEELDIADFLAIQEILEGFFSARAQS